MQLIEGVKIVDKYPIQDERGHVQHFMRDDFPEFSGKFGEVYSSKVYNGAVKAWHYHEKMSMNYLCVYGMIKFVLFDKRAGSSTYELCNEFYIGELNPKMICVPKNVWNGFKGYGERDFSLVMNFTDYHHEKDEIVRLPPDFDFTGFKYDWGRKDG